MPRAIPKGQRTKYQGISKIGPGRFLIRLQWVDQRTGKKRKKECMLEGTVEEALSLQLQLRAKKTQELTAIPCDSRMKFRDFAVRWMKKHKTLRRLSPSTQTRYLLELAHMNLKFGDWWIDQVDVEAIEQWQMELLKKYAPQTINTWFRTFRLIMERAVRDGLIPRNTARDVPSLPEKRTTGVRGRSLTPKEFSKFIEICSLEDYTRVPEDVRRHLLLIAWTGMRTGEALALRFEDIKEHEIHIQRSVWRGQVKSTKTDDPRRVAMPQPLIELIAQQKTWLDATQHPGRPSGLIFPAVEAQSKGALARGATTEIRWFRAKSTLLKAIAIVCEDAGLQRISPHSLRRTFEDLLREAGVEQMVRRAVAGWRTEKAQGIYATVGSKDRQAAAWAMETLVKQSDPSKKGS